MSRNPTRQEAGSVSVLTLLAFAAIAGAFLCVAVIGSRTAETARVRVAADATAMAAATVKAKVMNYQAFILLADTVFLPLGQITDSKFFFAQAAAEAACAITEYCWFQYPEHIIKTSSNQSSVDDKVTGWLDGLEALSTDLGRIGPQWAEFVAVQAGGANSYKGPGERGVTAAAAFPIPGLEGECSELGIEPVDNNEETRDGDKRRDACHDPEMGVLGVPLQLTYLAMSGDPLAAALDAGGMILTGQSLVVEHAPCTKENKVPKLSDNWKDYSMSRGLAISEHPADKKLLGLMNLLRRTKSSADPSAGHLLGIACAEHYSQDHHSEGTEHDRESLWHMDWRARLVPCGFEDGTNAQPIARCGAQSLPGSLYAGPEHVLNMQLQFEKQRLLGAVKYWKY